MGEQVALTALSVPECKSLEHTHTHPFYPIKMKKKPLYRTQGPGRHPYETKRGETTASNGGKDEGRKRKPKHGQVVLG